MQQKHNTMKLLKSLQLCPISKTVNVETASNTYISKHISEVYQIKTI
jgi:hypothetical protein